MVPRKNGYHGSAFTSTRGTTQGSLVSPTLFNVVVDNLIQTWLDIEVKDQRVDHNRLGDAVGRCLGIFYSNDGMVGSRDPEWLHRLVNVLVGLFRQYGLADNVAKYHTMTCQPGALRPGMSVESKAMKCTGVGD